MSLLLPKPTPEARGEESLPVSWRNHHIGREVLPYVCPKSLFGHVDSRGEGVGCVTAPLLIRAQSLTLRAPKDREGNC